jgi:hypothetical protein
MPLHPTFLPKVLSKSQKIEKFLVKFFSADTEYMLDVANRPILAEKSLSKTLFMGKIPKSGKTSPKFFFISTKPSRVF